MILPLWVSLLEIDFNVLVYEKHPVSEKFLQTVDLGNLPETEKWNQLNAFLFRERYLKNQKRELTKTTLGDTAFHRYETIKKLIDDDIKPFIELRNRIAHGQWLITFNSLGMVKNQQLTQKAWTLSKKDLMLFKIFVENFPSLFHNLILSTNAFEKDYDGMIGRINMAKKDIDIRFRALLKETRRTKK